MYCITMRRYSSDDWCGWNNLGINYCIMFDESSSCIKNYSFFVRRNLHINKKKIVKWSKYYLW